MLIAEIIVYTGFFYLAIGFLFAVYFAFFGVKEFDESAKESGFGFRIVIFFGIVAFWALFVYRLLKGTRRPIETNEHRRIAEEQK